jgi:quinolinate synthase
MNSLDSMLRSLEQGDNEIQVERELAEAAMRPLTRMLNFASEQRLAVQGKA